MMLKRNGIRFLCVLLATALGIGSALFCVCSVSSDLPGDADGDGAVTIADAALIARWCAGWDVTILSDNADVNGDAQTNLKDVTCIKRFLAGGWDVTLGEITLTFDASTNGGTFTAGNGFTENDPAKKAVYNAAFSAQDAAGKTWPQNPKKTGCSFKGWYTAPTGGTKVSATDIVTSRVHLTLYAQFGGYMETPEIGI